MNAHDLVFEYVLGALSEEETKAFEAELEKSPDLAKQVADANDAFTALPMALAPVAPDTDVKARLMKSVAGSDRFLPFAADVARYADLAVEKVRELFKKIDGEWEDGPFPGIKLIHFDGGPQACAADVGFVTLPAGLEFPRHKHHGFEVNYILVGAMIDDDGTRYGPGEAIEKTEKDVHAFKIPDESDTIIFIGNNGFEIVFDDD